MHAYIVVSLMVGVHPEEARPIGWEQDAGLDGNPGRAPAGRLFAAAAGTPLPGTSGGCSRTLARAGLGRDWAPRDLPHTSVSPLSDDTFAGTLVAGEVSGVRLDVFAAGGDDNAKRAADLAASGGLRPLDPRAAPARPRAGSLPVPSHDPAADPGHQLVPRDQDPRLTATARDGWKHGLLG
jgi:hypothetical protein